MRYLVLVFVLGLTSIVSRGQSITISPGTDATTGNAMIKVEGAQRKGFQLPAMNSISRMSILNPPDGLTVFDTDKKGVCTFYEQAWYCSVASGQPDFLPKLMYAADSTQNDGFGNAADIDGSVAVIGTPNADNGAKTNQGAVYVYGYSSYNNEWFQVQKLMAADGSANDNFGTSVALSGDYLVIGAPGAGSTTGAVYIYRKIAGSWTQEAKITASDGLTGDRFGLSVDFYKNASNVPFVAITAPGDEFTGSSVLNVGSAYLFSPVSSIWTFQQKFSNTDALSNDGSGMLVKLKDENTLVIAKHAADNGSQLSNGKVFTYRKSASVWSLVQTFTGVQYQHLGREIDLSGDFMVVGNSDDARVYKYNTATNLWGTTPRTLVSPYSGVYYGESVAIDGDKILVRDTYYNFGVFFKLTNAASNTWEAFQTVAFPDFCYHLNSDGQITAMDNGHFIAGEGADSCSGAGKVMAGKYNNN